MTATIFLSIIILALLILSFRCIMLPDEWFEEHKHAVGYIVTLAGCAVIAMFCI